MSRQSEVAAAVVLVHQRMQEMRGDAPKALDGTTCPLRDVAGFDSPLIPVAIRLVARELGIVVPPGAVVPNLYVSDDGARRLTISEVAGRFCRQYPAPVPREVSGS